MKSVVSHLTKNGLYGDHRNIVVVPTIIVEDLTLVNGTGTIESWSLVSKTPLGGVDMQLEMTTTKSKICLVDFVFIFYPLRILECSRYYLF